jgi:hypothetical protein
MDPLIILVVLLAVPVVLLLALRVNAAFIFLSLCLGAVLVQFVAPDGATILASVTAHGNGPLANQSTVNLVLQLLPVILTTLIMIHSVHGKAKNAFNFLPAVGVSALLALLTVPLLPYGLTAGIMKQPLWHELENLQTMIISVSTLLTLLFLWMHRPKRPIEEH